MINEDALIEELAQVTAMERKRKQMGWSESQFYAVPRSKKLPIFDEAHVRNAMARFNQTQGLSPEEKATAKGKISRAASKFGIKVNEFKKLSETIQLTDKSYVIRKAILMSPGKWNGNYYDVNEIKKAYDNTDWNHSNNRYLYLEHNDGGVGDWIGEVQNPFMDGEHLKGDVVIHNPVWAATMRNGKPKFGISPRLRAKMVDENKAIKDYLYENFSLVLNPAVKTTFLNNSEELETEDVDAKKEGVDIGVTEERLKEIVKEEFKALKLDDADETSEKQETTEEVVESMDGLTDLLELCELKKLSTAQVAKKAEELRAKDEKLSYTDAFRRAVKLQEEEEANKPKEEKPAEPKPEPAPEPKSEEEAKPAEAETETEEKESELSELRAQVKTLTEKLKEPEVKRLSRQEVPTDPKDLDSGMMKFIQGLNEGGY